MQSRDPADLLEAEHAVARVLAQGVDFPRAYAALLNAIAGALGWEFAAAWEVNADETITCVETWSAPGVDGGPFAEHTRRLRLVRGEALPGRAWRSGRWSASPTSRRIRASRARRSRTPGCAAPCASRPAGPGR